MFGRRARKQAEQEALQRMMEEAEANRRAARAAEEQAKVYYDSEIIFDDEPFDIQNDPQDIVMEQAPQANANGFVALPIHEDKPDEQAPEAPTQPQVAEQQPVTPAPETVAEQKAEESVAAPVRDSVEETTTTAEPIEEQADGEAEPEIRYVVDGPIEDEEIVKPAKLVKLPNLVDYMLSLNMSKRMKMNVATLLIGAYTKFKDVPAEKEIIVGCMKKIMFALMNG